MQEAKQTSSYFQWNVTGIVKENLKELIMATDTSL